MHWWMYTCKLPLNAVVMLSACYVYMDALLLIIDQSFVGYSMWLLVCLRAGLPHPTERRDVLGHKGYFSLGHRRSGVF
jgi:hypothetical protein